jgi:hypothetical protein
MYIEFGLDSQAIVILFGGMQICVPLPSAKQGAILGFLDPITGEESFREVEPRYMTPVSRFWTEAEARMHAAYVLRHLSEEANARSTNRFTPTVSPFARNGNWHYHSSSIHGYNGHEEGVAKCAV